MRSKQELRKELLKARTSISPLQLEKDQDLLLIQFQKLELPFLQSVHMYVPIIEKNEPDPDPLVRYLEFKYPGLQVAVPKMHQETLIHLQIDDQTNWVSNSWGIPEPLDGEQLMPEYFDLIFVPLLGFDLQGNRIGYGKGFYDRFLAQCRPDALKIGLSFLPPVQETFNVDPWDYSLNYCLTPQEIYAFT